MACASAGLYLVLFISAFMGISPLNSQSVSANGLVSRVTIVPSVVVMDSTSSATVVCVNPNSDGSPLVVRLSRNISEALLNLSVDAWNATATRITVQSRGFIGMLHLLCRSKDDERAGARADVIVKASAGTLQLAHRCQVYDSQYIKCILRASTIARAIRNEFTSDIAFTEITSFQAYKPKFEFLVNESTDEYLVFQWWPMVDGTFPDGVEMNIKITLPYFGVTQHRFDMTPSWAVRPDFTVRSVAQNKVLLRLASESSSPMCEFSVRDESAAADANRTWIPIQSQETHIVAPNAVFDSETLICVRCRSTTDDPFSDEECRATTATPSAKSKNIAYIVLAIIVAILLIVIPVNIYLCFLKKRRRNNPPQLQPRLEAGALEHLIVPPNTANFTPSSAQPGRAFFTFAESSVVSDNDSSVMLEPSSPVYPAEKYSYVTPTDLK